MKQFVTIFFCSVTLLLAGLVTNTFALENFDQKKYDSIQYKPLRDLYTAVTKGSIKGFTFGSTKDQILKKLSNPDFEKNLNGRAYLVYTDTEKVVTLVFKQNKLSFCDLIYLEGKNPSITVDEVKGLLGNPNALDLPNESDTQTVAWYGNFFNTERNVQCTWDGIFNGYFMSTNISGKEYLEIIEDTGFLFSDVIYNKNYSSYTPFTTNASPRTNSYMDNDWIVSPLASAVINYPFYPNTTVYESNGPLGRYLIATSDLPADTIVAKFEGPLTKNPSDRHAKWIGKDELGHDKFIIVESSAVYVNHSCNPNSTVDRRDWSVRTIRDVRRGEAITIAFNNPADFPSNMNWNPQWSFKCFCNQYNCQKRITDWKRN